MGGCRYWGYAVMVVLAYGLGFMFMLIGGVV
jgi:hypothetical protein